MTVPTREEEWAIWMRAAIAGDKAAYRRFLVAVTPSLRSLARRRAARLGLVEGDAEDVAARLKMTEGAVRVALHRALRALAALHRDHGD